VIKDGMTIDYQVTGYDFSVVNSLKYDGVLRTKFAVPVPK
jgi:hypothetical protein